MLIILNVRIFVRAVFRTGLYEQFYKFLFYVRETSTVYVIIYITFVLCGRLSRREWTN